MWTCPNCGNVCEDSKCPKCGIENLDGKVKNIVGSEAEGGYYAVSADFFKKKKVSKLCVFGFILSVVVVLFDLWIMYCFGYTIWYNYFGLWCSLTILGSVVSIVLNTIAMKKIDMGKQHGRKLAVAGKYIAMLLIAFFLGWSLGWYRCYMYL